MLKGSGIFLRDCRTDFLAETALDAGLACLGIEEAFLVCFHADAMGGASGIAGCATCAVGFVGVEREHYCMALLRKSSEWRRSSERRVSKSTPAK